MSRAVSIKIHPTQFPQAVRRDLLESLRKRQINHKFHYDSIKQTQKWLALHQAYSPSRTEVDCAVTYEKSFLKAAEMVAADAIHLIGLGCGGGQKDTRLLQLLKAKGKQIFYTPSDVSAAMVLVAAETASSVIAPENCFPFVCDLSSANDLSEIFDPRVEARCGRLFTFFGMIPNFEPNEILPKLAALLRPRDELLFSANLAPGNDYAAGVQAILPLYDNDLTRDWLQSVLWDFGLEKTDGHLDFAVEEVAVGTAELKRVVADFTFTKPALIELPEEQFTFQAGEKIRVFFSYRQTPELVRRLLEPHRITVLDQWITQSGEEGVFLCCKSA